MPHCTGGSETENQQSKSAKVMTSDMGKIFKGVLRSLKVQHLSETSISIFSFTLEYVHKLMTTITVQSLARLLPHNLRHTLPLFTADKLRSAHAQRPKIVWNTHIQTGISWKISEIQGKKLLNMVSTPFWILFKRSWFQGSVPPLTCISMCLSLSLFKLIANNT